MITVPLYRVIFTTWNLPSETPLEAVINSLHSAHPLSWISSRTGEVQMHKSEWRTRLAAGLRTHRLGFCRTTGGASELGPDLGLANRNDNPVYRFRLAKPIMNR